MKLKKNITLTLILFFICFMSGCTSIKETLTGAREQNTDEFLVKKKDPLVMPPEFNDLPKPQNQISEKINEEENIDFSEVLKGTDVKKKNIKASDGSLERSISKILNNK